MKLPHFILGVSIFGALVVSLGMYTFFSYHGSTPVVVNKVFLSVPYTSQAPVGWTNPWANACEEASATMVEAYYQGKRIISKDEAMRRMEEMFRWENEQWGKNEDINAEENSQFIQALTSFQAFVIRNPSLEGIKNELNEGRPVIAHVNKFKFYRQRVTNEKYVSSHVVVLIGYDDAKNQFIVNDPGYSGKYYSYDRVMDSLHDLDETGEANGESTVLFTSLKNNDL